jgi:2-methylcitrate dehydratase PrpD
MRTSHASPPTVSTASLLASWASGLQPTAEDLRLADRSLRDTVAVAYAAREHPLRHLFDHLSDAGRLAALAHVLDFDDLHLDSTTHISAVCVPVALASGGDARAFLAGAGVMARLGSMLGWKHYTAGWHATCTAGAPAAAVAAAVSRGLDASAMTSAIALAIPAAVGFAADAGVRAAMLAQDGATADPLALDQWTQLVGGNQVAEDRSGELALGGSAEIVPGGLAIKLYPCCYALQRPIAAVAGLPEVTIDEVGEVRITTPASSLKPLIHSRPSTGLEGKFSLEYGVAATLLDRHPGLDSFTDAAVQRPEARMLMERVEVTAMSEGRGLLDGEVTVELGLAGGEGSVVTLDLPPGAPGRPATAGQLRRKLEICAGDRADEIDSLTWERAPAFLQEI